MKNLSWKEIGQINEPGCENSNSHQLRNVPNIISLIIMCFRTHTTITRQGLLSHMNPHPNALLHTHVRGAAAPYHQGTITTLTVTSWPTF